MDNFLQISNSSFISNNFSNPGPIVVVSGWMDGSASLVIKYANIYRAMNYKVLILLSKSSQWLFYPDYFIHLKTFIKIRNLIVPEQDFILHLMSNGGCKSWYALEKKLLPMKIKSKLFIFDSCPTSFSKESALYNPFFLGNVFLHKLVTILLKVIKFYYLLYPEAHSFSVCVDRFIKTLNKAPKLFLYSKGDRLIHSDLIVKSIVLAKSFGTETESIDFVDSEHVQHFRKYPNRYQRAIKSFLERYAKKYQAPKL